MGKSIPGWQVAGFLFTSVLGTLLHFLFDFSGQQVLAALFSAVNESIWEHMKLIFYPMVLFAFLESRYIGKTTGAFWCIKLTGILLGLALIPVLYYTYTGIFGVSLSVLNIAIFFLAAGVAYWVETVLFLRDVSCRISPRAVFCLLLLIGAVFVLFTFFPPQIPFFEDPITGTYGFPG